jgi:SAM-dependent methyltransferase
MRALDRVIADTSEYDAPVNSERLAERLDELIRDRSGWEGHTLERGGVARFVAAAYQLPPAPATVLDVGCGTGVLVDALNEAGYQAEGVDSDEAVMGVMAGPHRVGTIDALPYADASFDVVVAAEVLEHLPVDIYAVALGELARVARRRVIITVPNAEPLDAASTRCPQCACIYSVHGHVRRFDKRTMGPLIPGYRLIAVDTTGPYKLRHRSVEWYVRRRLLGRWPAQPGAVCPQCGFRQPGTREPGISAGSTAGRVMRAIAGFPWQRWCLVAAYEPIETRVR